MRDIDSTGSAGSYGYPAGRGDFGPAAGRDSKTAVDENAAWNDGNSRADTAAGLDGNTAADINTGRVANTGKHTNTGTDINQTNRSADDY